MKALITGASSGIGKEIARILAAILEQFQNMFYSYILNQNILYLRSQLEWA